MSIFATLAVGSEVIHDGVRYKRDALHGLVILDDNPPLQTIDASQVATGVLDPARIPPVVPVGWTALANAAPIAAGRKYIVTGGNTISLVDIGQGNDCQIKLANVAQAWIPSAINFDVPAAWTMPQIIDAGPGTILTIVCDTAAMTFNLQW
jgi:hypothetical protein